MPPAMVRVTCPPSSSAPRNSNMAAMTTAVHNLRVLEPTLVPKELATSFAPGGSTHRHTHTAAAAPSQRGAARHKNDVSCD
jgi:quercetin dioxygenase-like cupin family protein